MGAGTRLVSAAVAVVLETRPSGGDRSAGGVGRRRFRGTGMGPGKEARDALPKPGCVSRPGVLAGGSWNRPFQGRFAVHFPTPLGTFRHSGP